MSRISAFFRLFAALLIVAAASAFAAGAPKKIAARGVNRVRQGEELGDVVHWKSRDYLRLAFAGKRPTLPCER